MFAGEGDMSKVEDPVDNGPYRDGKGSLYEGGTRVVGLANWPGHIQAGTRAREMIYASTCFPTLALLPGVPPPGQAAGPARRWPTISEGPPSPRTELV